jgi:hypothetical protein
MNRKGIPQGLKPGDLLALDGTAEAVPSQFLPRVFAERFMR